MKGRAALIGRQRGDVVLGVLLGILLALFVTFIYHLGWWSHAEHVRKQCETLSAVQLEGLTRNWVFHCHLEPARGVK